MRKTLFFLTIIASAALFGCDQPSGSATSVATDTSQPDTTRPRDEMVLIKKFADADIAFQSQQNDIGKRQVVDSVMAKVSDYLTNTLNGKATNWIAYVDDIHTVGDMVSVYLLVPKNWNLASEDPDLYAINLVTYPKDKTIINKLKIFKKGDRVIVSGEFEKVNNKVEIDPKFIALHDSDIEDIILEPNYNFTITDIKSSN